MRSRLHSNADLVFVVGYALVVALLLLSGIFDSRLAKALVGIPLLTVLPGYVSLAALSPRNGPSQRPTGRQDTTENPHTHREIEGVQWWVTSIGLSIVVVAAVSYVVLVSPAAFDTVNLVVVLTAVILGLVILATTRRSNLPEGEQYESNVESWFAGIRTPFSTDSNADIVLSVALGISILLLVGSIAFAAGGSQQEDAYTEFYLLTENESGDLTAADFPTTINSSESADMVVGVSNQEGEQTEYTIVAELQRVDGAGGNATVVEETEVMRRNVTVEDDWWWRLNHSVEPTLGTGDNFRVSYYLYRGEAPSDPSREGAYRYLEHWMTVTSDS